MLYREPLVRVYYWYEKDKSAAVVLFGSRRRIFLYWPIWLRVSDRISHSGWLLIAQFSPWFLGNSRRTLATAIT